MKILFTGDYLPDYNRTQIIKVGLAKLGHTVVEYPFKKKRTEQRRKILELAVDCDFIFMPSFTHREVGFVRKTVGLNKKIIFDPLISRYLTKVFDYELVWRWSLSALRNFWRDKLSMGYADFVVTDTQAHLEYFHKTFSVPKEKMAPLYIGNNFDEYYPSENHKTDPGRFMVGFYGGFLPLQGVMNILKAAEKLLPQTDIHFELVGSGFEFQKAQKYVEDHKLTNVSLPGWLKPPALRDHLQKLDLALGIFGETEKSNLVIPNKLYHYAACRLPTLTKDSPALREIFSHDEDLLLISCATDDIAQHILKLKQDGAKRRSLGESIHKKMRENYTETHVAARLMAIFEGI